MILALSGLAAVGARTGTWDSVSISPAFLKAGTICPWWKGITDFGGILWLQIKLSPFLSMAD